MSVVAVRSSMFRGFESILLKFLLRKLLHNRNEVFTQQKRSPAHLTIPAHIDNERIYTGEAIK